LFLLQVGASAAIWDYSSPADRAGSRGQLQPGWRAPGREPAGDTDLGVLAFGKVGSAPDRPLAQETASRGLIRMKALERRGCGGRFVVLVDGTGYLPVPPPHCGPIA